MNNFKKVLNESRLVQMLSESLENNKISKEKCSKLNELKIEDQRMVGATSPLKIMSVPTTSGWYRPVFMALETPSSPSAYSNLKLDLVY